MQLSLILAFATATSAACNGHDELCRRKYSDITFIGTHNSAFVGKLPVHNQYISVAEQLDLGVRFLQAQTQDKDGDIQMCHTHCWELDAGPLRDYLEEISEWVGKNPDEVVTIFLTNIDALPIEKFDEAFSSAGLKDLVFRPKTKLSRDEWPTLQKLLEDRTRLVVFMGMPCSVYSLLELTGYPQITTWTRAESTTYLMSSTISGRPRSVNLTPRFQPVRLTGRRRGIQPNSWGS